MEKQRLPPPSGSAGWRPEIGWTGYDPTLGVATSGSHVVTGVSNHPRGVMPISGTFFDAQDSYLGMTVTVQTERLAEAPKPAAST